MSWYTPEGILCGVISLARYRVQLESKDMGNDGWPRWNWDRGGSVGGRMGQMVGWDLSIKGSIHDWVVRRHEVIHWFTWDPGIGVRMHFTVDSCQLLEDKQSLAREDCNVLLLINRGLTEE